MEAPHTLKSLELELHHLEKTLEKDKSLLKKKQALTKDIESDTQTISLSISILENYLEASSSTISGTLESLMQSAMSVLNMNVQAKLQYSEGARGGYSLVIEQNDVEGGIESFGGAVFALIGFIMLISTIILKKKRRFLVLDESLNSVSFDYQETLSKFIRQLCDDFGFDILLISHQPELDTHANRFYEVSKQNGKTSFHCTENQL